MKKETIKKEKAAPKLVSYTMTAIIPTGQYQNIQPSIVVEASTLEQAQAYVMPHIEALYKQYHNYNENKVEIKPSVKNPFGLIPVPKETPVYVVRSPFKNELPLTAKDLVSEPAPATTAYEAAENAIARCTNMSDLSRLENRISDSTKLSKAEKQSLNLAIMSKETEIKYNHK